MSIQLADSVFLPSQATNQELGDLEVDKHSAELAHVLRTVQEVGTRSSDQRLELDPDNLRKSLGQLVLTLVRLLHEVLERQAIRRIDGGGLTDKQIEDLGVTLMRQAQEIDRLVQEFGLTKEDLNIDLGPIGRLF